MINRDKSFVTTTKSIDDFLLTETVTVKQAREWMKLKDDVAKHHLITLIYHRFNNRYVKHLHSINSGFLKMAVSCLMIETMESFRQGKKNTKGKGVGEKMFRDFFTTEETLFPGFKDIAHDFYSSIRCGILHQAETTNAWRIVRKSEYALLDRKNRTINATKFVKALGSSLNNYINCLRANDLNTLIWQRAILKIEDICKNCKVSR